jgi:ammonium transporter Rh
MLLLLLQVPLYALNQHLCFKTLQALDMGGSITIHAFGAYYGLAASLVLSNKRQAFGAYTSANPKNSASYISDLFSIIGTLFLWMFVSDKLHSVLYLALSLLLLPKYL